MPKGEGKRKKIRKSSTKAEIEEVKEEGEGEVGERDNQINFLL